MQLRSASTFPARVAEAKTRIKEVKAEDAKQMVATGNYVLIDVREDNEWAGGHAKEAVHIGRGVLDLNIEDKYPDKANTKFLVYCQAGARGAMACDLMQTLGYKKVSSVQGGYKAIVGAGWDVTK